VSLSSHSDFCVEAEFQGTVYWLLVFIELEGLSLKGGQALNSRRLVISSKGIIVAFLSSLSPLSLVLILGFSQKSLFKLRNFLSFNHLLRPFVINEC
jgi:hypothetical protein